MIKKLLSLTILALFTGISVADEQRPVVISFGTLQTAEADAAKSKAQAWLKAIGKTDTATQKKFNAIWNQKNRSVLDRVTDTIVMANADAAKLLQEVGNPLKSAPTEVPGLITNKKSPAFLRNNLALAYARQLVHRRIYEEALAALKTIRAEDVVDPSSFLFHRAVCEHGLLEKKNALNSINRLIKDVIDSPERYKMVSLLMLMDMETWKSKDLAAIARKMENIERRLDLARGGPVTQKLQKDVVRRLDEIIKKLENKAKSDCECQNGGSCPNGGQSKPGNAGGDNPSAPMKDSQIANNGGSGDVNQAKLRKLAKGWGNLPERERTQILQELTRGLSSRHREAIENYFRRIAEGERR